MRNISTKSQIMVLLVVANLPRREKGTKQPTRRSKHLSSQVKEKFSEFNSYCQRRCKLVEEDLSEAPMRPGQVPLLALPRRDP